MAPLWCIFYLRSKSKLADGSHSRRNSPSFIVLPSIFLAFVKFEIQSISTKTKSIRKVTARNGNRAEPATTCIINFYYYHQYLLTIKKTFSMHFLGSKLGEKYILCVFVVQFAIIRIVQRSRLNQFLRRVYGAG